MLNLVFVQTFLKVADYGSFTRAAEEIYLSKVSVMNQVNALEKFIGAKLFHRTNHGVVLTEAGKSFYKNAENLIRLSKEAVHQAQIVADQSRQVINIGTSILRPCNGFIETLTNSLTADNPYRFNIIPFNDEINSLGLMLQSLGNKIDCFVSPCGSMQLLMNYNFLPLVPCKCAVAMSRKHILAEKKILSMEELHNQSVLLLKRGNSYVLDQMRDDLASNHPSVSIIDFNGYYDISAFNLCEQQGYLMETLDIWAKLHPSLKTVPVDWKYEMPYGVIYSKKPTDKVTRFINYVSSLIASDRLE